MPRRCVRSFAALALLVLAGCGAPRLDTTNEETTKASVDAMTKGMSETEKQEFSSAVITLSAPGLFREAFGAAFGKGNRTVKLTPTQILKPLNGMTAAEIIAKAKAVREEIDKQESRQVKSSKG